MINAGAVIGFQGAHRPPLQHRCQCLDRQQPHRRRVVIHPGCAIGQDGFGVDGSNRSPQGLQIGRVIIQDDVEIGP